MDMLEGIGDDSYKMSEKAVGRTVLLLANKDLTKASPIQRKSKQIEGVCNSSKDTERLVMKRLVVERRRRTVSKVPARRKCGASRK